ncbi:ervatamin-B-like [Ananas comosus]|uniref:Ervatamin-B-like n=1 Tax=Ananas comosus TaxID=4615 RepID=A0A6P5FW59_ANACO|nr:ervatamin-B-like [Ananas comosus]
MASSCHFIFLSIIATTALLRCLEVASLDKPEYWLTPERHEKWMAQYGRVYKDADEKQRRYKIFKDNANYIEAFNKEGKHKYTLGINQFTDLTTEEFVSTYTGARPRNATLMRRPKPLRNDGAVDPPTTVDWRAAGAVTYVRDQGACSSCWAFSAVAAMEGIIQIVTGQSTPLSEQEIIDCDFTDRGCSPSWVNNAFRFVVYAGGINSEADYPYTGTRKCCDVQKLQNGRAATIYGYEDVPPNDENALMNVVANRPVSVNVDAAAIQHYSGGIFDGPCGSSINHAMCIVGYGQNDDAGTKYWIVKNSWGTSWGDEGYIYFQKDVAAPEGMCGLATSPSYPTM